MVLSFVALTLLVDFTHVLFDKGNLAILASRPVSDRTLFAAQLAHALVYLALIAGSLALPSIAVDLALYGPVGSLTILLCAALAAALAVFLVVCFYGIALRAFGPERFRDVVLYAQIAFLAWFFGGYQVLNFTQAWRHLPELLERHPWLPLAFPPAHFAGLFELAVGQPRADSGVLALLAIAVPVSALALGLWLNSSGFITGLGAPGVERAKRRRPLGAFLAEAVTRPGAERAGYDFALGIMRREALFLRTTWPPVIGFWVIGIALQVTALFKDEIPERAGMVGGAYVLVVSTTAFFLQMRFSENHEAGWILNALPLRKPGELSSGACKAVAYGLVLPLLPWTAAVPLVLGRWWLIPDLLLAMEVTLFFQLVTPWVFVRDLPFRKKQNPREMQASVVTWMLFSLLFAVFGAAHFALALVPYGVPVGVLAMAGAVLLLHRALGRRRLSLRPA
jgi:hypothetical protein